MKMPDKINHNEQPDEFSRLIKQKLEDYRIPVGPDSWNEIELRMKPKQKKSVWWIGGSVAAIAVIVILLLSIPQNNEPPFISIAPESNFSASDISGNIKQAFTDNTPESQTQKQVSSFSTPQSSLVKKKNRTTTEPSVQHAQYANVTSDSIGLQQIEEVVQNIITGNNENVAVTATTDSTKSVMETKPANKTQTKKAQPPVLLLPKANNESSNWLVAAAVSSGGTNMSSGGGGAYNLAQKAVLSSSDQEVSYSDVSLLNREMSSDDINIDHAMPLSFGLTVRKDLNSRIGIETGVVYTYLSSKSRWSRSDYYHAKQELHYLGVPVNLVVYLWNNPKWNVYVSGGGMIEKGLSLKYTEIMQNKENNTASAHNSGSIHGVQWSLNTSLGVSYMLYDDWSLYFEPRFSYYFDNNQPTSIRTEKSSVFGIGAGIRYKF